MDSFMLQVIFFELEPLTPLFFSTTAIIGLFYDTYLIIEVDFEVFLTNSLARLMTTIIQEK